MIEEINFRLLDIYFCICAQDVIFAMIVVKVSVNYDVYFIGVPANRVQGVFELQDGKADLLFYLLRRHEVFNARIHEDLPVSAFDGECVNGQNYASSVKTLISHYPLVGFIKAYS